VGKFGLRSDNPAISSRPAGMTNGSEPTLDPKAAGKARIFVGLFVLLSALPPFINATGNPRIATLHGSDVMGLFASGLCFGFGLALLIGRHIFGGK
jgi:hypothetical protein